MEIRHLLADKGRSTLVPPRWIGEILRMGPVIEGGQPYPNKDQIRGGKKSLRLQLHQLTMGYEASLPIAFFGAVGTGGRTGSTSHD